VKVTGGLNTEKVPSNFDGPPGGCISDISLFFPPSSPELRFYRALTHNNNKLNTSQTDLAAGQRIWTALRVPSAGRHRVKSILRHNDVVVPAVTNERNHPVLKRDGAFQRGRRQGSGRPTMCRSHRRMLSSFPGWMEGINITCKH